MSSHDAPSEPEPRTPIWLTALGACLFVALAFFLLAPRPAPSDATIRVDALDKPTEAPAANDATRTGGTPPTPGSATLRAAPTGGSAPTIRNRATAADAKTPTLRPTRPPATPPATP